MRKESLRHSSLPCDPFEGDDFDKEAYHVASTGAIANLSSSISLIYLYCSRLPADGLVSSLLPLLCGFSSFILMNLRYTFFLHHSGCFAFLFYLVLYHLYHLDYSLRYFKPTPRWDKVTGTLYLPKSCPLQPIHVVGDKKLLKNIACLEACKQLHKIGALTDNLVPDIIIEAAEVQEFGNLHAFY